MGCMGIKQEDKGYKLYKTVIGWRKPLPNLTAKTIYYYLSYLFSGKKTIRYLNYDLKCVNSDPCRADERGKGSLYEVVEEDGLGLTWLYAGKANNNNATRTRVNGVLPTPFLLCRTNKNVELKQMICDC